MLSVDSGLSSCDGEVCAGKAPNESSHSATVEFAREGSDVTPDRSLIDGAVSHTRRQAPDRRGVDLHIADAASSRNCESDGKVEPSPSAEERQTELGSTNHTLSLTISFMAEHVKDAPGYWMYEQSGVLIPVVQAYLHGQPMTLKQIATMRAYLRQWISAPGFIGPEIDELRGRVDGLTSQEAIDVWIYDAVEAGADPL